MQIFVINLKRAVERRTFMEKQLQHLRLPYHIFEATDGSTLAQDFLEQQCDLEVITADTDTFTEGMVGAAYTHYSLYKYIVEHRIPIAFIIEDDVKLHTPVPALLQYIEQNKHLFNPKEPLLLHAASEEPLVFSTHQAIDLPLSYIAAYPMDLSLVGSSAAYVIFREAAEELAKKLLPIKHTTDDWQGFEEIEAITTVRCVYPVPTSLVPFESQRNYSRSSWIGKVKRVLNPNKLYFVGLLLKERRRLLAKKKANYSLTDEAPAEDLD